MITNQSMSRLPSAWRGMPDPSVLEMILSLLTACVIHMEIWRHVPLSSPVIPQRRRVAAPRRLAVERERPEGPA